MAKNIDSNQLQKIDRLYNRPIYFCHLLLNGLTLYFSDRCFKYNGHDYEDYLFDLSNIGNEIQNLGGYDNAQLNLRFKNAAIQAYNTLIELFDDYPPEKRYIETYKLFWDPGETYTSDVATKIFKGEMGQPYEIPDPPVDFKINVSSMLFGKNASLPLDVINLADFPSADPDDVGKYRNIPIGSIKKLVCPWTVAGWVSTLTADITSSATSIVVSDSTSAPATPFSAKIDNEEISVTNNVTATGTLTISRAQGGTTAVAHNKGQVIYEKRADFEAEVSMLSVKSIGNVYGLRYGDWMRITSGVTKYTNSGGRAKLVFSDKIKFEEKINQAASNNVNEGSHPHSTTGVGLSTKHCIPNSATGFTDSGNAIDGNEDSRAYQTSGHLVCSASESNLGTINKQYIWILTNTTTGNIYCGGTLIGSVSSGPTSKGWYRFVKNGGAWGDDVDIYAAGAGTSIYEVYREVEYTPNLTIDTHAATNVGVTTTLVGNSVANMLIGDLVACDVEGIPDDGSGTYTGTPNALIERPDHVRKWVLMALLGFAEPDIDESFDDVGDVYAAQIAGGYKFAFNLPDVATETMELFRKMDEQSRSNMFESQGLFKLAFNSTDEPDSEITFSKDNIIGSFLFGKTEVVDIKNLLRAHYFRDYSKTGDIGQIYQKINEESDATSISKYGELQEDLEFDCIGDLSDMVGDALEWMLLQKKDVKKLIEFIAKWEATLLDQCDHFTVTSTFWTGLKWKTLKWIVVPEREQIEIAGEQFISS